MVSIPILILIQFLYIGYGFHDFQVKMYVPR